MQLSGEVHISRARAMISSEDEIQLVNKHRRFVKSVSSFREILIINNGRGNVAESWATNESPNGEHLAPNKHSNVERLIFSLSIFNICGGGPAKNFVS